MNCFNYFTFKLNPIICPKCNWTGLGKELSNGEFYDDSYIAEFNCPNCNTEVGFIQFPMKEQVDKWEKENPGKKQVGSNKNFKKFNSVHAKSKKS